MYLDPTYLHSADPKKKDWYVDQRADIVQNADAVLGINWKLKDWGTWTFFDNWDLPSVSDGRTYFCPHWD